MRLVVLAALALAAAWWITSSDGLFTGTAGFRDVTGTWRLDVDRVRAALAAKQARLAGMPGGEAEWRSVESRSAAIRAPYAKRKYTFLKTSYLTVEEGGESRETPCSYVGESPVLLRILGEDPGDKDDLTFVLDPQAGCIHLRLEATLLPFVRD
jgi:hypothetical protein